MSVAFHATINPVRNVCQRKVLRTNPKGIKTECVFADGTSILVSNFLASFIRAGDDLLFSVELETADSSTEIYIRDTNPGTKRRDVLQTRIGYASQPRKDKRNNLFVSPEVSNPRLGVSAIHLPSSFGSIPSKPRITSFWLNFDAPRFDGPEQASEKAEMTTRTSARAFRDFNMRWCEL